MKSDRIPAYRLHTPSGQAIVCLNGKQHYLGKHNTSKSRQQYDRLVAEWLARGRTSPNPTATAPEGLAVVELLTQYKAHARQYYRKHGRQTNEFKTIMRALKVVQALYGRTPASDFDTQRLLAVRAHMIQLGWTRKAINKQITRVRGAFHWATEQKLIPGGVAAALMSLRRLQRGRSDAPESPKVEPVPLDVLEMTLAKLSPPLQAMVKLQLVTAARPDEICQLRPRDIDRRQAVWIYIPPEHKTEHLDRQRVICIGPQGQAILQPFLDRAPDAYCFNPQESELQRREATRAARRTPQNQGNRPGSNRRQQPKRRPGARYSADSYRRAIHRACVAAGVAVWGPYRLRHNGATTIAERLGEPAAQVVLGHSSVNVTKEYIKKSTTQAAEVMGQMG